MAKKKRSRRRKQVRLQTLQPATNNTTSSDDSHPFRSGRPSSDDYLSDDPAASESAQTAMTSVMNTDECDTDQARASSDDERGAQGGHVAESSQGGEYHDDTIETASLYPRSRYPGVPSSFRTETPYFGPGEIDSASRAASIRSLWAQDLDYREIHGRQYCQEYYKPIDEMELMRQSLIHQVFLHVLNGEPTLVPLDDPKFILDVGTGTGDWAIKLAEMYPHCDVVGTDIAATAETSSVPQNVNFEIEDAEDWERSPDQYDLIHFRAMDGAFQDWEYIYGSAFYSINPGGWIEVQDMDSMKGIREFAKNFPADSVVYALLRDLDLAAKKSGRELGIDHLNPQRFADVGFTDIQIKDFRIPITAAEKTAGKIWLISCLDAFEAVCLRLLTEQMDWDPDECKAACEQAARAFANLAKDPEKSKELNVTMRVVIARKSPDFPRAVSPMADEGSMTPMEGIVLTPDPHAMAISRPSSPPPAPSDISSAGVEETAAARPEPAEETSHHLQPGS